MSAESIAAALRTAPAPVAEFSDVIPPAAPGFYAWWIRPGVLPDVPAARYAEAAPWELLYLGIAPGKPGSAATIRSRVNGQHRRGNTGSSTFRLSIASLLFEREGWRPERRAKKVVLNKKDNTELSCWIRRELALTVTEQAAPWQGPLEAQVIRLLRPPINLERNQTHPFHDDMSAARDRFKAAAA